MYYLLLKDYINAEENYTKAIEIYGDKDSVNKADVLQFRANKYFDNGKFLKALKDYQLAADYYRNLNDTQYMFYAMSGIINVYGINGFDEKTIKERDKLINSKIKTGKTGGLLIDYYNQSLNYKKLGNKEKQEEYLIESNTILDKEKTETIALYFLITLKSTAANSYTENNNLKEAKKYLDEAEEYYKKVDGNYNYVGEFLNAKAKYLFKTRETKEALKYTLKALKINTEISHTSGLMEGNQLLSKIYEKIGKDKQALDSYKNYTTIKDSIFSVTKTNALSYYQALYETEQKEKEIVAQKSSIDLLAKENEAKNRLILFVSVGAALLFLMFYLYRNRVQSDKKRKLQEEYSQKLLLSQEEERKCISKDLHDSLGQSLLLIKNKVSLKSDDKTKELVDNAIEEMRSISRVLHPFQLEDIGISRALENLITQLDESYKNILIFGDIDDVKFVLNPNKEVNVFRIVQECLSNIIKHAKADSAKITLIKNTNSIVLSIKDNGVGFDFSEKYNDFKSLGLKTIKERVKFLNGTLKIDSVKNEGTTFTIQIPT